MDRDELRLEVLDDMVFYLKKDRDLLSIIPNDEEFIQQLIKQYLYYVDDMVVDGYSQDAALESLTNMYSEIMSEYMSYVHFVDMYNIFGIIDNYFKKYYTNDYEYKK